MNMSLYCWTHIYNYGIKANKKYHEYLFNVALIEIIACKSEYNIKVT